MKIELNFYMSCVALKKIGNYYCKNDITLISLNMYARGFDSRYRKGIIYVHATEPEATERAR